MAPRWRRLAIGLAALALLPGCASWDWRGQGFDNEPKIGRQENPLFPAAKGNGVFGFSTKSQQIERNLGVE